MLTNNAGTEFTELSPTHHPIKAWVFPFSLMPTEPLVAEGQERTFIHYQKETLPVHLEPSQKGILNLPFLIFLSLLSVPVYLALALEIPSHSQTHLFPVFCSTPLSFFFSGL